MMRESRHAIERVSAQAGIDDAGTPGLATLLWGLLGGAFAWSLQLLVSYTLVAYACAVAWRDGARTALLLTSVVAFALTLWAAIVAWRAWHVAREVDRPKDDAWDARMGERTARVSFLMVAGLLTNGLFAIAIVYHAMSLFLVPLCEPGVAP